MLGVRLEIPVDRRLTVRAPMALVLAGVGVEDDDAAVAVPVGHEDLVRLGVDANVGRAAKPRRVVAPAERPRAADLHQECPVARELEDLAVALAVAADPDVVHVVDEDAVLFVRPVEAVGRTAPALDDVTLLVELEHRRRRRATLGGRRVELGATFALAQRPRPLQHPDVIARVDRDANDVAEQPVVW